MPLRSRSRASSVEQEVAAVVLERAQFVEVGVVAGRDDAAVAHLRAGSGGDRADQQVERRVPVFARSANSCAEQRRPGVGQRGAQAGEPGQRFAQAGQVARPGVPQRDAAGDAFDVGDAAQGFSALRRPVARSLRAALRRRRGGQRESPRSRSGWCRVWRSRREPMLVTQLSSSENRVGAGWPRRVSVISRLRRVAGSRPR